MASICEGNRRIGHRIDWFWNKVVQVLAKELREIEDIIRELYVCEEQEIDHRYAIDSVENDIEVAKQSE